MGVKKKKERWKWIPGYRRLYKVSDWGRIKSYYITGPGSRTVKTGRLLGQTRRRASRSYLTIHLYKNGKCINYSISRLVLLAFVGPCPKDCECAHYDGNLLNNYLENLRWATKKENAADTKRHGHHYAKGAHNPARGEVHWHARLTEKQVRTIRKEHNRGSKTCRELANHYNITRATVGKIIRRETWAWLK